MNRPCQRLIPSICRSHRLFCKNRSFSSENKDPESFAGNPVEDLLQDSVVDPKDQAPPEFPSDAESDYWSKWESYNQWASSQTKHAFRPKVNPSDTSILLFPGQGSQFVGMGKELLSYPNVPEMFKTASKILGYDLLDLCLNGPKSELDKTQHCQPAILVTSLAAVEKLQHDTPQAIENCISASGFSVGEIAALSFAGSLTFEQAVELVKVRGEAMQSASEAQPSGMMTVFLSASHKIKFACHAAREYCSQRLHIEDPVCQIANYLYPDCKVIAGHEEALQFIEKTYTEFGIKRCKRLPVSGAFHTKLMAPAGKKLKKYLENINFEAPVISVHSNASGFKYKQVKHMKKQLVDQVTHPVKWEQIMHILYARPSETGFPCTYEVGPGKQMGFLLRQVNRKAFESYYDIEV